MILRTLHCNPMNAPRTPRCRGSVMLLVIVAVAIATIISLTFMTAATSATSIAHMVDHHAQARQIAESGLQLGRSYLERDPLWREDQEQGVWVSEFPLMGGNVSLQASFDAAAAGVPVAVANAGFESTLYVMSGGFMNLNPEMSKNIGGWTAKRSAILALVVPAVSVSKSAAASEGQNIAKVVFGVGVVGAASFGRTLAGVKLEPSTTYTLEVDMINLNLLTLLPSRQLTLKAGGVTVATASDGNLLTLLDLNASASTVGIQFTTTDSPPAGDISIEVSCSVGVGLGQAVGFDNVKLVKEKPLPVLLTATATHGDAGHVVSAMVMPMGSTTPARIMEWTDP